LGRWGEGGGRFAKHCKLLGKGDEHLGKC